MCDVNLHRKYCPFGLCAKHGDNKEVKKLADAKVDFGETGAKD